MSNVHVGRRVMMVGAGAMSTTACFGGFGASRWLYDWNSDIGGKWVNWLVFFAFLVLGVYPLFMAADLLVLNTIEFWTGSNPVLNSQDGRRVTRHATNDPSTVRLEATKNGKLVYVGHVRRTPRCTQILDERQKLVAEVVQLDSGSLELRDSRGRRVATLSASQVQDIEHQIQDGESPIAATERELGEQAVQVGRLRNGMSATTVL